MQEIRFIMILQAQKHDINKPFFFLCLFSNGKDTESLCSFQIYIAHKGLPMVLGNPLFFYFFLEPKIAFIMVLPTFRSNPCLVIGIPVFRLIFCLTAVIPTALFKEKLNPGIFIVIHE